jgi:hypothetical protein
VNVDRFIAERGEENRMVRIEKIDEAYELKPLPQLLPRRVLSHAKTLAPEIPLSDVPVLPR